MKGAKASEDLRSIGLWNSRDDYKSDVVGDQISPSVVTCFFVWSKTALRPLPSRADEARRRVAADNTSF